MVLMPMTQLPTNPLQKPYHLPVLFRPTPKAFQLPVPLSPTPKVITRTLPSQPLHWILCMMWRPCA